MKRMLQAWVLLGLVGCGADHGETPAALRSGETASETAGLHYAVRAIPEPPAPYGAIEPLRLMDDGDFIGVADRCDGPRCREDVLELGADGEYRAAATDFFPGGVTREGDIAGCTVAHDGELSDIDQAAIVHVDGSLELLPRLPGELRSCVSQVSDGGTALVLWETTRADGSVGLAYYVWLDGQAFADDLGEPVAGMNDRGEITGTLSVAVPGGNAPWGYRYDARTQTKTLLPVVPCDADTFAFGINQQGDILGYSQTIDGVQHVATWNAANEISVLFTQGNVDSPTVSRRLVWNESGLVVLSDTSDFETYLLPAPGVRVDLASLVDGVDTTFLSVSEVNERGDFLAFDPRLDGYEVFVRQ